ncbi:hypothetical protein PA08_0025 [Cutibacterium modestum P08]|nr:hypothetical protein PA08_0025 [Cutibacterium modestum P08]
MASGSRWTSTSTTQAATNGATNVRTIAMYAGACHHEKARLAQAKTVQTGTYQRLRGGQSTSSPCR